MKDIELYKLYTIEAFLKYAELPDNYREGWSPSYGLHFEETCIQEELKISVYISINGKLKKNKCDFIQDKNLADQLLNYIKPKLEKRFPSIKLNIRNITRQELDYRRKKALEEAIANNQKITLQLCP
ncbi:TPA: hypothetical protein ACIFB9_001422 [Acinetobacter baumannii]|uniref:hypothetical protein n=1 Tax=Acinetobacter baumannii TaxID=470 RepID=UPI0001AEF6ED|nr:hypothetical protein [Acinetobacter baumannii]EHU1902735.1 hypothetical protein [Acinetobacter baumannii]EHU1919054.1 hypothetical protein [Acinetobacter baumannii]EHU1964059.1 hypothetical protein [Acinetobacter baumannii]EKP45939.1 hypothetical protein ACIN5111_0833 [Acinetobacter baumannii OIFC111]EKU3892748.1 hypothetical protein [Acinetobacter baumannii]